MDDRTGMVVKYLTGFNTPNLEMRPTRVHRNAKVTGGGSATHVVVGWCHRGMP
jgi:hypothetical protein